MSVLLEPGGPLVIGHRGAAAVLPENTLPSIRHAIGLGVDAVEFDVRVTSDGVAVVHHDPTTARTCGDDLTIARSELRALRSLNAAARRSDVAVTRIPLLDEVLEETRDTPVIIECKTVDAVAPVLRALAEHRATTRVVIGSFLHDAMLQVRAARMPSGASRRDMTALLARALVGLAPAAVPYAAMCIPERSSGITLPIARFAAWGRRLGVPVHIWTVNDAASARRLWDAGVTGILSDDPGTILAARAVRGGPAPR